MFEHLEAEDSTKDTRCADFVDLFARFQKDSLAVSALIEAGTVTKQDRFRMHQFAIKIDRAWTEIPEDKKKGLVEALLIKKLLPEEVKKALQVFGAKVIKVA